MTPTAEPGTFDKPQLARLLQCSVRHIDSPEMRRVLPAPIRLGALVRWDRETVMRWLAEGGNTVSRAGRVVQARG